MTPAHYFLYELVLDKCQSAASPDQSELMSISVNPQFWQNEHKLTSFFCSCKASNRIKEAINCLLWKVFDVCPICLTRLSMIYQYSTYVLYILIDYSCWTWLNGKPKRQWVCQDLRLCVCTVRLQAMTPHFLRMTNESWKSVNFEILKMFVTSKTNQNLSKEITRTVLTEISDLS